MDTVNGMPRGSRGLHGVVRPAGVDTGLPGAPEAKEPVGLTSRPACSGLGKSVDARPGLTSRQGGSLTPFGHGGEPHTGNQLGPGKQTPRLSPLCTLLGGETSPHPLPPETD